MPNRVGGQFAPFDFQLQTNAQAVGAGTPMDVGGFGAVALQIKGITTATITFEATVDGVDWVSVEARNVATDTNAVTATADGIYQIDVAGIDQIRARVSAYTSGTINVYGKGQPLGTAAS